MASDAKEVVRRRGDPAHSVNLTPVLRFSTASAGMADSDHGSFVRTDVADYIGVVHALFESSLGRFVDADGGVAGGGTDQLESRHMVPYALSIGCMIATAAATLAAAT